MARREQVQAHTTKKSALENEVVACNKLTSAYFVNISGGLCYRPHSSISEKMQLAIRYIRVLLLQ